MINIYLCDDEDRIREQIQAEIEKKILIEAYDMCVAFSTNSPKELLEASCRAQQKQNIYFLDASSYAEPSSADQEHLDEEGHRLLADAVLKKISEIEENVADE